MRIKQTHIDFGHVVSAWSYKRFMTTFRAIYPDADLEQYATELGLVKPDATEEGAPATDTSEEEEDFPVSDKKQKRGRGK